MTELTLERVRDAALAIRGVADGTPLVPSPFLSELTGAEVLLKLELAQASGAFKLRGATSAISNLPDGIAGVTCYSTGNHGRAVAYAAKMRGLRAVICMSSLVPKAKVDGIKALGAEVRISGTSQDDAEAEYDRLIAEEGLIGINPFDALDVIAGQGTIGLELLEARPDLEAILIPLSGGGLAGGIAFAAKKLKPGIRTVGITMERGPAMHDSIRAGRPVEVEEFPSLADSLGGGIGLQNRHSFTLCRDHLDETHLVTEAEIYRAMQALYYEDRLVCEGGAAVPVAALMTGKVTLDGPAALIVTGRNVDMAMHADIMAGRDVRLGETVIEGRTYGA
ncbi:MAG: hydroxyectoine utilization dehydratase EutB [Paracoccaceae bacterium]|nr:hydroxyectoine utilization dehydratase EutB [Paracoccaceae bacterium]